MLDFSEPYLLVWDRIHSYADKHDGEFTAPNIGRYMPMNTRQRAIILIILLLLLCHPAVSRAEMHPLLKNRAGVPPADVLREILATQQRHTYEIGMPGPDAAPFITWLADPDARIQPHHIISRPERKIFAVRSLGNQITSCLAAIDFGIRHLYSPVLLITGNTDSETLRLFSSGYANLDLSIRQELNHLYPALVGITTMEDNENREKERRQVEENVDYQVEQAMGRYGDRVANGRLLVVGSVYDLTGTYGRGVGRLIIININGEKNDAVIKKMELLRTIPPGLLTFIGRQPAKQDSTE